MSEFREYKLSELGKWLGGGTPSKAKKEYWLDGTIPWVSPKDMKKLRIDSSADYITQIAVEKTSAKLIPKGSVLIVTRSGILQRYVPIAINEVPVTINQDLKVIIPNGKIRSDFLANSLRLQNNRVLHECAKVGTTVESLGTDLLKGFKIVAPDIDVQDRIMAIIGTWDEAISKTEKLIQAKKRYKKGLMQRLLSGKVRFPEFEGEDWVEVKLGEVFDRITNKNESESVKNVLTISAQDGLVSQTDYYNKSVASKDLSNYIVLRKGDFAYNKSYSEGYPLGAIKRLDDYEKGVLSPLYICFRLTLDNVDSDFIAHFFEYRGLDHGIYKIAREGARNHGLLNVSVKDFFEIDLTIPQCEEQKKIASVLNEAMKEIELLESQLEKYQQQKKGLMQQLLTGKVRVC